MESRSSVETSTTSKNSSFAEFDDESEANITNNDTRTEEDEWYYYGPNKSKRLRFKFCNDCDFKTIERSSLVEHVKSQHSSSTTALPSPSRIGRPTRKNEEGEWHYFGPNLSKRTRFKFCGDCSYKTTDWRELLTHVKKYHPSTTTPLPKKGRPKPEPPPPKTSHVRTEEEEWYIGPDNKRKKYQFCGDCDYKVRTRESLQAHVKSWHPSSTTALPPPLKIGRPPPPPTHCSFENCSFQTTHKIKLTMHEKHHREKSAHRCLICNYSTTTIKHLGIHVKRDHPERNEGLLVDQVDSETTAQDTVEPVSAPTSVGNESEDERDSHDALSSQWDIEQQETNDSHREEDEYKYFDSQHGHRRRYQCCGDCDYKTVSRAMLVAHVKRKHRSSKTALPPPLKKGTRPLIPLRCSHQCDYQTTNKVELKMHESRHQNKSTYQCLLCTYSVNTAENLRLHMKRDHSEIKVNEVPSANELSALASKEKFYVCAGPYNSRKIKYKYCGDCDFHTYKRSTLVTHVQTLHPKSTTALPPITRRNRAPKSFPCSHCNHKATSSTGQKQHELLHRIKSDHQCPFCTYSTSQLVHLNHHLNNDHLEDKDDSDDNMIVDTVPVDSGPSSLLGADSALTAASMENTNESSALFCCPYCRFQVRNRKEEFRYHLKFHKKKSPHQCPCCSYSCRTLKALAIHLNCDHLESDKANGKISENQEKDSATSTCMVTNASISTGDKTLIKERGALTTLNSQCHPTLTLNRSKDGMTDKCNWRYHFCSDCNYKTSKRSTLIAHAKLLHPSSTTAVPPPRNQRQSLSCSECRFQCTQQRNLEKHEKLHGKNYPYQCPLCSFSVTTATYLRRHLKLHHSKDERNHIDSNGDISSDDETNSDSSTSSYSMSDDEEGSEFCSVDDEESSGSRTEEEGSEFWTEEEVQKSKEINWKKQFSLRECYVKLFDIAPKVDAKKVDSRLELTALKSMEPIIVNLETEESECLSETDEPQVGHLSPGKQIEQEANSSIEREEKIKLMSSRVKFMEEKVRIADEELNNIKLKKDGVSSKIKEIIGKKVETECELRTRQCDALELKLSLLESPEIEAGQNNLASVEETIKRLECRVEEMENELRNLRNEEECLAENWKDAERSYTGTMQVLDALQFELKCL